MVRLSLAIGTLTMWLVPHIGVQIKGFRILVRESKFWTTAISGDEEKDEERSRQAQRTIDYSLAFSIVIATLVYVGTAIGVALTTQNMDARADAIVIGTGYLISAVMLTQLSYKIPKWLGVYYWSVESNTLVYEVPTALTVRELRFNVYWSIWKIFAQVYFLMSLQFCAAEPETVPVSAIIGICAGLIVFYGIYIGWTRWKDHKYWIAAALAAGLSIAASAAWAYGIYYVQTIWKQSTGMSAPAVLASMFFSWAAICIILNVSIWYYTKRKKRLGEDNDPSYNDYAKMELFAPGKNQKKQEREEVLQPESESKASAAASSSLAVGQVVAAASDSKDNNTKQGGDHNEHSDSQEGVQVNLDDVEGAATADEKKDEGAVEDETEQIAADGLNEKLDDEEEAAGMGEEEGEEEEEKEDEAARVRRLVQEAEENQTFCKLLGAKCCCKCCCNKERNGPREQKSCCEKFLSFCKWFIIFIVNVCCLYVTICNIGATSEMEVVRYNYPNATRNLYPPDYQNGTMCAWDEPTSNGILETFDTLEAVYEANWTVAHCEACANCSNWNDMEIQWRTRDTLASTAMSCAVKSIFGGPEAVQECYIEETGFTPGCAWCWTGDSMCSKNYCTWIFLQAMIINNVGNFSVGPRHVTSATCEEAMCGEHYAPCAGATRRRMNIESDIERPEWQQCSVAEHDWAEVFNYP